MLEALFLQFRSPHLVEVSDDGFIVHSMEATAWRPFATAQALDDDWPFDLFAIMCCALLQSNFRWHFDLCTMQGGKQVEHIISRAYTNSLRL